MKVLIDTNVVLDILLKNAAFYDGSMAVFVHAEQNRLSGYISPVPVPQSLFPNPKYPLQNIRLWLRHLFQGAANTFPAQASHLSSAVGLIDVAVTAGAVYNNAATFNQ